MVVSVKIYSHIMDRISQTLEDIGARVILNMEKRLKQQGLSDSNFINDIDYEVDITGDEYELVVNMPNYGIYINNGRKPNSKMPPKNSLLDWMSRKGIPRDKEFPIRKMIGIRGIKPRPFFDAFINTVEEVNDALYEASGEEIRISLNKILEKIS